MPQDLEGKLNLADMRAMIQVQQPPDCPFANPKLSPKLNITNAPLAHRLVQGEFGRN